MAIGDFENRLNDEQSVADLVTKLGDYASAWWDMRNAGQMMYDRGRLGADAGWEFGRRAMLDGAVMAYSRCFESGRRRADIRTLVNELDEPLAEMAKVVDKWRDHHVAHRVNRDWEAVEVTLLWGNWKANPPTVRARVFTQTKPRLPDFEKRFEALALHLSNRIWEVYLWPLQQEMLDRLGAERVMLEMKANAVPYDPKLPVLDRFGVTADIGSSPPGTKG
jgi:hypothetical protein